MRSIVASDRISRASARESAPRARAHSDSTQTPRADDPGARAALWQQHWPSLYAYFSRQVRNREEAEDLASETLVAALERLPAICGYSAAPADASAAEPAEEREPLQDSAFAAYLKGVARHKLA